MDVIVQAGTLLADIPGQHPAAVPEPEDPVHQVQGVPHRAGTGKGTEVLCLVLLQLPGHKNPREGFPHCYLNIRIGLVVPQHGIVARAVLLDQIVLKDQRFQLRIRDDIFETLDPADHLQDLRALSPGRLKVLPHPVPEADGLSDVDDLVMAVMHDVNAGRRGKLLQFLLNVEKLFFHSHFLRRSPS